jgi:hypothetical protein
MENIAVSTGKPARTEKASLYELGFEIIPFRDLPREHQMAMAWYMAIDGEAWEGVIDWNGINMPGDPDTITIEERDSFNRRVLEEHLDQFIATYGDVEFGIATWPTNRIIESIYGDDDKPGEDETLAAVYAYYQEPITGYHVVEYPKEKRWPVIMSGLDEETLQDGWHRFKIYASNGHQDIPVMFYPKEWHYELRETLLVSPSR